MKLGLSIRALLLGALAPISAVPTLAYDTSIVFEGLEAVALYERNGSTAKKARVILIDSSFPANDNPMKARHVSKIMFREGSIDDRKCEAGTGLCWKPETGTVETIDRVTWEWWDLSRTRVTVKGDANPVDLTGYVYDEVLNLETTHGNADLGRVADGVWSGNDPKNRVQSRVHLAGGNLSTASVGAEVDGNPVALVYAVYWKSTQASEVWLSPLANTSKPLKIYLATPAEIRISNEGPGMTDEAHHIREFYFLTKAGTNPNNLPQAVYARRTEKSSPDAFCPPVGLGRP